MSATKPTTKEQMEEFAKKTAAACQDHEAWLAFVRYGLSFLLDNQPLLIELVIREAVRLTKWAEAEPGYVPVEEARRIFEELGLKLTT